MATTAVDHAAERYPLNARVRLESPTGPRFGRVTGHTSTGCIVVTTEDGPVVADPCDVRLDGAQ